MTDLEMDLMLANARIKQLEKELADKKPTVVEAIATITKYCKAQQSCDGCYFFIQEKDSCFFAFSDLPCDWDGDFIG